MSRWGLVMAATAVLTALGAGLLTRDMRQFAHVAARESPISRPPVADLTFIADQTPALPEASEEADSDFEGDLFSFEALERSATIRTPPPPPGPIPPPPSPAPAQVKSSQAGRGPVPQQPLPATPSRPARSAPPPPEADARRVRVADESGEVVVARVYGDPKAGVVLLPDGKLGWPDTLVYIDESFRPLSVNQLRRKLLDGPYKDFPVVEQTEHYLVFSKGTRPFAQQSVKLLESQYRGLIEAFRRKGLPAREAEFPLVAVIDSTEAEFRARKRVAPEVQAYYEVLSNRIFFYETSDRDRDAPDVAALRKPQTIAHEGAHQVLQNIGIQPRLAPWPLWLVEGLAEYCAPTSTKKQAEWAGLGHVNPFHMATYRDLRDPLTLQLLGKQQAAVRFGRDLNAPWIEELVQRTKLTPTDYALSWALTFYLANKRTPEFISYLKEMSRVAPSQELTPQQQLKMFRHAFGGDQKGMTRSLETFLGKQKASESLVSYAVVFEQAMPNGLVRRGTIVSQSPAMIRQWVEGMTDQRGGAVLWHAFPYPNRSQAMLAAQQWINGY